ncbi:hypothetical protein A9974_16200 [Achromobacter sp. UMC71]|nr:hypothetical protein [Achromobacter sp. UMC71]
MAMCRQRAAGGFFSAIYMMILARSSRARARHTIGSMNQGDRQAECGGAIARYTLDAGAVEMLARRSARAMMSSISAMT